MLIDSHCHLDFDVLSSDLPGVITRMREADVVGCVTISTWVKEYALLEKIAQTQKNVWFSIGTHPCNAAEEPNVQASELIDLSAHGTCVAIGEAGLDYFH
ncbi:MAG: TatD family hydrolase, partial [Devosiaceae bacterium]|nr:TatD family hydrolase [Devosiaceae bacterium]